MQKKKGATLSRLVKPPQASDIVTDELRKQIVRGDIALGAQLSENALAAQLGISRTPVREAFMRLESEKLVRVRPQRGTFVFTCDVQEATEICELRAILEIGAMRLALQRNRDALISRLRDVTERSVPTLALGTDAYQPLDIEFHETIFELANNQNLREAYSTISARVAALRWRLTVTREQLEDSHEVHCQIVDWLARGNTEEAAKLMDIHVNRTRRLIKEVFEGKGPSHIDVAVLAGE